MSDSTLCATSRCFLVIESDGTAEQSVCVSVCVCVYVCVCVRLPCSKLISNDIPHKYQVGVWVSPVYLRELACG